MIKRNIDTFFRDLTAIGSSYIYGIVAVAFLILGETRIFLKLLIGAFFIHLIAAIIRIFYFKPRPKEIPHKHIIERIVDSSGFPSIHCSKVFFLMLSVAFYFSNIILTSLSMLLALFISYSRIYLKKHDYVDVIAGIALGIAIFWIFQKYIIF